MGSANELEFQTDRIELSVSVEVTMLGNLSEQHLLMINESPPACCPSHLKKKNHSAVDYMKKLYCPLDIFFDIFPLRILQKWGPFLLILYSDWCQKEASTHSDRSHDCLDIL